MEFNSDSTVKEVREHLDTSIRTGKKTHCPCCNRTVRQYKRSITSAMAYGLILLVRNQGVHRGNVSFENKYGAPQWFHMENTLKEAGAPTSIRGDMSKWVYWGCLERNEKYTIDSNPESGLYRLTKKAVDFVLGWCTLKKYIKLHNRVSYGFDGDLISIKEALQNKFNYDELMRR